MANPFQQQVRIRKLVYTGLILVLLTTSWMHRKLLVEPMADDLQLREASRGEVELLSSAVTLTLTGSRGAVVTWLWYTANHEQDRHKWNEVELLVSSITKLQPHFITPWMFQSWNLAFNVAVENDKPRDKFYYVSRGIQLLADGERRNQGAVDRQTGKSRFPGNPDMRHSIGFTYQLKIGTSDEKHAMQCLLDLSCIDPVKRKPSTLWPEGARDVDLKAFETFCQENPRLVRRLSENLDYNTPRQVVNFLKENYIVPARFRYDRKKLSGYSMLAEDRAQFPVVPPHQDDSYPSPNTDEFTPEAFDVFLVSRTWFKYSQLPLPPTFENPGVEAAPYDPVRNRLPKHMTTMIFRGIPARAQGYIAETLEAQGWYDEDGWEIKEWFDPIRGADQSLRVGKDRKYWAQPAWNKTYDAYREFGVANGLYVSDADREDLEENAKLFRERTGTSPGVRVDLRADEQKGELGKSWRAHQKLAWNDHYRHLTNFDEHLNEADAERDPEAVRARKLFFYGEQLNRSGRHPRALAYFEESMPLWLDVLLRYPKFAYSQNVQEDTYERELKYLRLLQRVQAEPLRTLCLGLAELPKATAPWPQGLAAWVHVPLEQLLTSTDKVKMIPIRNFRGPLDSVVMLQNPRIAELRQAALLWSQAGLPQPMLLYPGQQNLLFTTARFLARPQPNTSWGYLVPPHVVDLVRSRMGLSRLDRPMTPMGPMGQ